MWKNGCLVFIVCVQLAATQHARAQQWFQFSDPPIGGVGTDGTNLLINTDGDPEAELYPVPADLLPTSQSQFFLAPSRQILYAVKLLPPPPQTSPPCNASHSVRVYFYRINQQNDTGGTLDVIHDGVCLGDIAQRGFFDPPNGAQRIGFIAERADLVPTTQTVLWVNLNSVNDSTMVDYTNDIGFIKFSPTGLAAFVQHDLTTGQADADYTFTCLHPDGLGSQIATFQVSSGPAADAALELNQNGDEVIHIYHNDIPQPAAFVSLDGCGPSQPETGPCCLDPTGCTANLSALSCAQSNGNWLGPGASCSDCPPPEPIGACCSVQGYCLGSLTLSECAANNVENLWLGDGVQCSDCPHVDLSLTKSGSVEVNVGEPIVYTLQYENTGTTDAHNTVLRDYSISNPDLPVIPSGNGVHDPGSYEVRWDLGTVPAGEAGQVTVSVGTDCLTPPTVILYGGSATISSDFGGYGFIQGQIETTVNPLPDDPLDVSVTSVPSNGVPLFSGDTLVHTITLTNTASQPRVGVHFSVQFRNSVEQFVQTLDDGGGVVDTQYGFAWTGDIGANATVSIAFEVQIRDCLDADQLDASLNRGEPFDVLDACESVIGTLIPQSPMPLQPSLIATVTAINLDPPTELATFLSTERVQAAGDSDSVVLQIEATNYLSAPLALDLEFYIPFGLEVATIPPFVSPTNVAASYDDTTGRVFWSGTIDGMSTMQITIDTVLNVPYEPFCRVYVNPIINSGNCTDIAQSLVLQIMPTPPVEARLVGYSSSNGELWWMNPLTDTAFEYFSCTNEEFTSDLAISSQGEIWVTGAPFYRINPLIGEFQGYPHDFYAMLDVDLGSITKAAGDPTNNSVLFLGAKTMPGQFNAAPAWRRYDSLSDTVTPLGDLGLGFVNSMVVDNAGWLVAAGNVPSTLARVDPTAPAAPQPLMADPNLSASKVALDQDGDYIVMAYNSATGTTGLYEVDSDTTGASVILPSLRDTFGSLWLTTDFVVTPDGGIYIAEAFGGLAVIHRQPPDVQIVIEQNFTGFGRAMNRLVVLDPSTTHQTADCDQNGGVDLVDWFQIENCLTGPESVGLSPECSCADVNASGTVDLRDLFVTQSSFDGPPS